MNSLSVAQVSGVGAYPRSGRVVSYVPTESIAWRESQWGVMHGLASLPEWERKEIVRRAVEWGVMHGLRESRARGLSGLAQDSVVQAAVQKALAPIMPTLGAELVKVVQPAAEKAAATVGPVLDEKLRTYGPWIGAIAGTVSAILSIIGMVVVGGYVVKKVG